jgi:cytochrome P450
MTTTPESQEQPARTRPLSGPPRISGLPAMFSVMREFSRDPLAAVSALHDEYGDTVYIEGDGLKQMFTRDPEVMGEVMVKQAAIFGKDKDYTDADKGMALFLGNGLLTSNGDFWRRQRKLVAPALHTRRIERYAESMVDFTLDQMAGWRDGARLDISREMNRATLRIVAQNLFSANVDAQLEVVTDAMDVFQKLMMNMTLGLLPAWVPTPLRLRARAAKRDLDALVYALIAERRAGRGDHGDLLTMLLEAETEDGERMSDAQARDEIVTLFLAGHETTANTLNWTWMLLARHPEVEANLHAELDAVLDGRPPTLADLKALPYTEMVIKESLRLYPPAWMYSRQAARDTVVAGYAIQAGTTVAINAYGAHRDPKIWPEAEAFIPERFSAGREADIPRYAYVPFGGGPRICVGSAFAMMEAQLMLATVAARYRLTLDPGQRVEMLPLITLNPKGGLPMTVRARRTAPAYAHARAWPASARPAIPDRG